MAKIPNCYFLNFEKNFKYFNIYFRQFCVKKYYVFYVKKVYIYENYIVKKTRRIYYDVNFTVASFIRLLFYDYSLIRCR